MNQPACSYENALISARRLLQPTSTDANVYSEAKLEAEILLCHVLQCQRALLYTWPQRQLTPEQAGAFFALIQRRQAGEPLAYILQQRAFWGLNLKVTPATLIPRADTETLVEAALEKIRARPRPGVLDLGTGSGAIILAIASEYADAECHAIDFSADALAVAQHNAHQLALAVHFFQGNWFEPVKGRQYDIIVSNPPYIELNDPHLQQGDLRFEPATALSSGADGLDDLRLIIQQAWSHLHHQGWLLVEHGYNQAEAVAALFAQQGYQRITLKHDLSGQPRVTLGQKP
ncbi:MAG: peptide chain release factor N(5)-glutamine methyltransferase [Thiomicrospira sp.]|jgi:release factor glutamine methyltransferase|nr:peptide chain release factor N(5)-glutamine methyltransferase [Thiomicrospira sp.]